MDETPFFPLADANDHEILMHRDVHFGGSFSVMREYYEKEGKGVHPDFELERIEELQQMEQKLGSNLSDELLQDFERKEVAHAKEQYQTLSALYDNPSSTEMDRLIADLILSEEERPDLEIAAIVAQGEKALKPLTDLLLQDQWNSPLFPGYGEVPGLAARCLGLIGDERAIQPLFHALGRENFFTEESILDALKVIGEKAKRFLINSLLRMPITKENEHAAIALLSFENDREIARACLKLLQNEQVFLHPSFAAYLIMGCESLADEEEKQRFIALAERKDLSSDLRQEMAVLIKKWKKDGG